MNPPHGTRRWLRPLLPGLAVVLLGYLALPSAALAHSLDQYLQATYITVAPGAVTVELDLSPGVLVAPAVLPLLDTGGDRAISDAEARTYVAEVLAGVSLEVDGQPVALAVTKIDMPDYVTIQAGYGTIRAFTTGIVGDAVGSHSVGFTNAYAPAGATYQINAFVATGTPVTLGPQNRDARQQTLRVDYAIAAGTVAAPGTAIAQEDASRLLSASGSDQVRQLLASLSDPTASPLALILALALAALVGGLHALTPGHGKALAAAYLVGSRGTVRHASYLGGIVTVTHTASVIGIGVLALVASQVIVPNVLVPALEAISGLLVLVIGTRLLWRRWTAFRAGRDEHGHGAGDLGHDHGSADPHHAHAGGRGHTHDVPPDRITLRTLVAMGISGGIVPCPEALGIMVIAVGLNRIAFGLGLIVSFSLGIAAVLILIGVLLVRARPVVERFSGRAGRWSSVLPLASAAIVVVLGIGMTLTAVRAYLAE